MANAICTNAWITESANILFAGGTPPDPAKFKLCLATSPTLGRTNTIADFVISELLPVNGYERSEAIITMGSYDTGDQRFEMTVSNAFNASGGALQFQTIFLLANAKDIASKSFTNADVNPTTDTITINSHGFSNGDKLTFTPDGLNSLPGGIEESIVYTVSGATTNTFSLSGVNIANTGSGTFRARSADGIVVAYAIESAPVTIPDGQGRSYQIGLAVLNTGYVDGV